MIFTAILGSLSDRCFDWQIRSAAWEHMLASSEKILVVDAFAIRSGNLGNLM